MHVVLILFILVFTVFFCHSLIRLCMLALKPSRRDERDRVPSRAGVGGFAQPHRPIRVVLARDEELGLRGAEAEEGKNLPAPPPAYGLWRGSVVCVIPSIGKEFLADWIDYSGSTLTFCIGNVLNALRALSRGSRCKTVTEQRIAHQVTSLTMVLKFRQRGILVYTRL